MGAYSKLGAYKISPFSASVGCLFCNKSKKIITKREDVTNQVSVKYSEGNSVFGEVSYSYLFILLGGRGKGGFLIELASGRGRGGRLVTFSAF